MPRRKPILKKVKKVIVEDTESEEESDGDTSSVASQKSQKSQKSEKSLDEKGTEFLLNLKKFTDWSTSQVSSLLGPKSNKDGVKTNTDGRRTVRFRKSISRSGRSPLPKGTPRRSRSASAPRGRQAATPSKSSLKQSTGQPGRAKLRKTRPKAINDDTTLLRTLGSVFQNWAKSDNLALTKSGAPLMMPKLPETYASVNIPIRNGILTMRPQRINQIDRQFLESMKPGTLREIAVLRDNLSKIMLVADDAKRKKAIKV